MGSMKHLVSLKAVYRAASIIWPKNFDIGEMKYAEFSEEKRRAILCLYDFEKFHAIFYFFLAGFLTKAFEMVSKSKNVKVEQTKFILKGDPHDEFKITW